MSKLEASLSFIQIQNCTKGQNIDGNTFDAFAKMLGDLNYEIFNDDSLPIPEEHVTFIKAGSAGPSSSNEPLAIEDDPTHPKEASSR